MNAPALPLPPHVRTVQDLIAYIGQHPAEPALHAMLGDAYAHGGQAVTAAALYRTAMALGASDATLRRRLNDSLAAARGQPFETITHNVYFRIAGLARHLLELFPSGEFSLLDAGGGDGRLATLLPKTEYVLAEPDTNGVFVTPELSLGRRFDCVVCCHVLEHIPIAARDGFLDALCRMAGRYLVLLNPVVDAHTDLKQWQQLIYDITGAKWAKEHIDCVFPRLEEITGYAERRGYSYRVKPNGSKPLSLAFAFLNHFSRTGKREDVAKMNQMFNSLRLDDLDNPAWPNAYLVEIALK